MVARNISNIEVPHGDNHDLWIAPDDPMRMIQSNDGGANVSNDGGQLDAAGQSTYIANVSNFSGQ